MQSSKETFSVFTFIVVICSVCALILATLATTLLPFQKKAVEDFSKLPLDMQQFVSKPANLPYLELAQRLSEMSVERLRAVAEGLLEITL